MRTLWSQLPRVRRNPFGRSVVPDVNSSRNGSSRGRTSGPADAGAVAAIASKRSSETAVPLHGSTVPSAASKRSSSVTTSAGSTRRIVSSRCSSGHSGSSTATMARNEATPLIQRATSIARESETATIGTPPVSASERPGAASASSSSMPLRMRVHASRSSPYVMRSPSPASASRPGSEPATARMLPVNVTLRV